MSESEKWAERVKEFRESGKSQRVWSAEQGIKRSTLRYWLERTEELSEGTEIRFAELVRGGGDGDHVDDRAL
ncbi:MAG: hypothetical protein J5994_04935 [Ruminococcus sp.]|nr:hypothetical protein [Ruminococcus sp.]